MNVSTHGMAMLVFVVALVVGGTSGAARAQSTGDASGAPAAEASRGVQVSIGSGLAIGLVRRFAPGGLANTMAQGALRLRALVGPTAGRWAIGPEMELRRTDVRQVGAGLRIQWQPTRLFAAWWRTTAGKLTEREKFAGPYVANTIGAGFRVPLGRECTTTCVRYVPRIDLYVSHRAGVGGRNDAEEFTVALEVDLLFPAALFAMGVGTPRF